MKSIYKTILAAAAAIMALNSCVVDNVIPDGETVNKTDGSRIISISFGPGTKSVLDGFQPKFAEGDTIKISNGVSAPENRLVKINDHGNAYITTDLMGALKAVYPASAAELKTNEKLHIDTIAGVKVPAVQSGKFADANICTVEIGDAATTATFKNEVAILKFYVDKSIGVKKITVTSTESNLASGSKTITVDPDDDATIDTVTDDPEDRICYVAVLPGTKSNLKFTGETTTQGSVERQLSADTNLERAGMYNAFIPYYIDLGKAGKWAYCNIGAFLPEEPGKYFAWGDTKGQNWNGSWSDEFKTIEGNPDTLKLENDAAHVIWGDSWRMPTKAQLDTLAAATKVWSDEIKGYKLYTSSADTSIFLPAAGSSADMSKAGTSGEYWSSSLSKDEKQLAYKLGISNGSAATAALSRAIGATIRPFRHIPVESIELNKTKDTVKIDNVATLIATVYPTNASDTLVTWISSNTGVATVDQRGHITGVAGGTATITAKIIDLNGTEKNATCEVTVPAKVESVALNKSKIDALNVGSTETLTATITPSTNTIIVSTTWSSDATSIATVDKNGKITGVAPGPAKITVKVKDVYDIEKTAECSVTVLSPVAEVNGDFSVSSTLKVRFAKGNLKYDATNKRWGTYDKQYEFNNSSTYDPDHKNLITLFNWGYNAEESIKPNASSYTNVNITGEGSLSKSEDWGYVFGGDNSPWRTLTKTEWEYLINHHTVKKNVTVCGVAGCVVLAPDNFSGTIADSYDANAWATAENKGLVCLPPVGYRVTFWDGTTNIYLTFGSPVQRLGYYWTSSSIDETYGFKVTISDSSGISCDQHSKNGGCAVRLVKNV